MGAALLVLLLCLITLTSWELWRTREDARAHGEQAVANLAHVLAEQTARTIQAVDFTLIGLRGALLVAPGLPAEDSQFRQAMRERLEALPYVGALFVVDPDGFVVHDTNYPATPRTSLTERPYFRFHQEHDDPGLHISDPLISPSAGVWFISLTRRLNRPDGSFGGVVVAAVEPRYFERFYEGLEIGADSSIALVTRDGVLLARQPHLHDAIGRSFTDAEPFRSLLDTQPTAVFWQDRSPIDGTSRVVGYRAVDAVPLVVLAGVSQQVVMAQWRNYARLVGATMTLLVVLLLALLTVLWKAWQRDARAEAAIRLGEERLRVAVEGTGSGIFDFDPASGAMVWSPRHFELFGLPWQKDGVTNRDTWCKRVHDEDRARVIQSYEEAGSDTFRVSHRIIRADTGAIRWVETIGRAVEIGGRRRIAGLVRDVTAQKEAQAALAATERRYRALAEAGAVLVWRADLSGAIVESRGWKRLTGQPDATIRNWNWLDAVHPEDRDSLLAAWAEARAAGRPAQAEFRVHPRGGGGWRWMRARAVPVFPEGASRASGAAPSEWMGVLEDVHERRQAEKQREILSREVDHRARNLLAVVQAVLRLTPRRDPAAYAASVERRIAALGRAHSLLAESRWEGAELRALGQEELAAYGELGDRVVLEGPPVSLAPEAAQGLSMVLHELATNAAKHGSLLAPDGRVSLTWRHEADDDGGDTLHLHWEERGGPPVTGAPSDRGFGSRVIQATIAGQLGGRVERRWETAGLVCEMWIPIGRTQVRERTAGLSGLAS